jgi:hypothetical protein
LLILYDHAYFPNHLHCPAAQLVSQIDFGIDTVFAVVDEAPANDGLEVVLHQQSIGSELVFVI